MNLFNKLPGFARTPAGFERVILRRLPALLALGTILLCLPALFAHASTMTGLAAGPITMIDIYTIGAVVLHWTIVFTVGVAAFIVMVMKGPAYVADAYPMNELDEPARHVATR